MDSTLSGEKRGAAYQRISYDKSGDEHGVTNQLADQKRAAEARGYTLVISESDNDISALTGQPRPGYQRIMAAAARREIDAIFVFQTSRFWRNRRERAEGIEILRKAGVSIIATKGPSLDMSTAYGRAMAGLLGEFDTMESEVKSERQQLANREAAYAGKPRLAQHRPFGWMPDHKTASPEEKAAVEDACAALLAGGTLAGITRDWAKRGLRPHQAPYGPLRENPWGERSVKLILLNPRNAGIAVYRGEEVAPGEWEPLVLEETYRAIAQLLTDPSRAVAKGVTSVLGSLALCRCGNYVSGSRNRYGIPTYRCNQKSRGRRSGPHIHVQREPVEQAIGELIIERMSMADAVNFLAPAAEGDASALRAEAQAIHARLGSLGRLFVTGQIKEQDLTGGRDEGERRLAEIEAELAMLGRESVLAPLIVAENVAAVWEDLGNDRRRAVVDALMTVTLYPPGPGARQFNRAQVLPPDRGIIWKHPRS